MRDVANAIALLASDWIGFAIWFVVAAFIGALVFHRARSVWKGALVAVLIFFLPLWDLIPGLTLYSRYARELAGVRVFKTVEADGYLDGAPLLSPFSLAVGMLINPIFSYKYYEVPNFNNGAEQDFINEFGYWEIRLAPRDKPECAPFEAWSGATELRKNHANMADKCVVAIRRDAPISRYEFQIGSLEPLPGPSWLPKVYAQYHRVIDRESGEVLGQAYSIKYTGWLSSNDNPFRFLMWSQDHKAGETDHILDIADVVKPLSAKERP